MFLNVTDKAAKVADESGRIRVNAVTPGQTGIAGAVIDANGGMSVH